VTEICDTTIMKINLGNKLTGIN